MSEKKEPKIFIDKSPVPDPDAPPPGTKYFIMDPITKPMSHEERLEMHAGALLAIDNIEDARKIAKIFLFFLDKANVKV